MKSLGYQHPTKVFNLPLQ